MDRELLRELYVRRHAHPDKQAYIYTSGEEPEPLCAIYAAAGLANITAMYYTQRLARYSMKYALDQLTVDSRSIPEGQQKCFENLNYPPGNAS